MPPTIPVEPLQMPLPPRIDPTVTMMTVEEKPDVTYDDVGGAQDSLEKLREVVELPLRAGVALLCARGFPEAAPDLGRLGAEALERRGLRRRRAVRAVHAGWRGLRRPRRRRAALVAPVIAGVGGRLLRPQHPRAVAPQEAGGLGARAAGCRGHVAGMAVQRPCPLV